MKKTVLLLVALVFLLSLAVTQGTWAADKVVKIGAVYPLTGYLSWLGEYYKKAALLQVEQINKAGGVNGYMLELVVYDDQSSPEEATRAALRLVSKDQVVAITGTATAPITGAVSSVAQKNKIPAVLSSGYDVKADKEPFLFNTAHPTFFAIGRPFMYLKKQNVKGVALLMPIGSLGEIGIANSKKASEQFGIPIVGEERFDVKAPEVSAQLAKLRGSNPGAIFSFTTGEPAALVAKNMAQLKIDVPLVVSHGNATPGFLKLASGLTTSVIVPTGRIMVPDSLPANDPCKPVIIQFNKLHQERYGEPANYFSGLLADAVMLIAEGMKISKSSTDPVKIRDGIEKIKNFPGLGGVYNMSPTDHYGTKMEDMVLITIKGGKWAQIQ
jgi:branched-chain amino acid transport system substrate-binding protein